MKDELKKLQNNLVSKKRIRKTNIKTKKEKLKTEKKLKNQFK